MTQKITVETWCDRCGDSIDDNEVRVGFFHEVGGYGSEVEIPSALYFHLECLDIPFRAAAHVRARTNS